MPLRSGHRSSARRHPAANTGAVSLLGLSMLLTACNRQPLPTGPGSVASAVTDATAVSRDPRAEVSRQEIRQGWPPRDSQPITADGDSGGDGVVAVSADGRFVAFTSNATNLVPDDTNICKTVGHNTLHDQPGSCRDVFVRDIEAGITRRISVGPGGEQANGESWAPAMSPDGRYVAFRSAADNLAAGYAETCAAREFPDHCHGIFVADTQTSELDLLFVLSDNGGIGFNDSVEISPDGRYVLFDALGETEPLPGLRLENRFTTLLYDREAHEVRAGQPEDRHALQLDVVAGEVSADERWRVFASEEALLPDDTRACDNPQFGLHNCSDIYLEDLVSGALRRLSLAPDGAEADGDSWSPTISADGRHIAFESEARNLEPEWARYCVDPANEPACRRQVYLVDRDTGAASLISRTPSGVPARGASVSPRIAANGARVVFDSFSPDLVFGDHPSESGDVMDSNSDVFVYERATGQIEAVSVAFQTP